mmetsp:Transcript_11681/g.18379  ORF Transcript_11681/g.18379 Transcript_11681/m.18379 type:complete len:221 (-) Transcript_11681:116-778(-)
MTVQSIDVEVDHVHHAEYSSAHSGVSESEDSFLPTWVTEQRDGWGEKLVVPEWEDSDGKYRDTHGWKGRDLVHDVNSPVRILEYYVNYGNGSGVPGCSKGGMDTTLTGIAHFTRRAESHQGFCHGGSMCSLLDDVIGWVGFLVTGECKPWSGFTVQINSSLKRPIPVGSVLLVKATITKVERRKVSVVASIEDPQEEAIHATGDGLVIVNRGVLPDETCP